MAPCAFLSRATREDNQEGEALTGPAATIEREEQALGSQKSPRGDTVADVDDAGDCAGRFTS
jgi:hypothetical protein